MSDTNFEHEPTLTLKVEPEPRFWSDVMITAFDGHYGGVWYWANASHSPRGTSFLETQPIEDGFDGVQELWVACWIRADEETGSTIWDDKVFYSPYRVTWKTLAVGMEYLLSGKDANGRSLLSYDENLFRAVAQQDAGDIDSNLADTIVQLGVFGEVVFG